ncbi:hypothetical protein HY251_07435, partial [bacterium]|nr:hypothetical protein [bacterium]
DDIKKLNMAINGNSGTATYEGLVAEQLGEFNRKLQETIQEEWASSTAPDWERIQDETVKGFWKTLREQKDKQDKYTNLVDCQKDTLKLLQAVLHVVPRLRIERIVADQDRELKMKQIDDLRNQLKSETDELKGKLAQKEDQYNEFARKKDAELKRLLDEKDKLQKDEAKKVQDFTVELQRKELEIRKHLARIDQLTKKQQKSFYETSKPDGEVTFADAKLGYCWIDIGKMHGLRRGTQFQVYTLTKGGRQKFKAFCEVQKIDQDMSQCAVLQGTIVDPSDPVVKGDLVRNPIFERNAQPKFWFLGTKLSNRYYNKGELERKIEEFGGKVLKSLSVDVDYVVILQKGDEEFPDDYKKATELGATFMKEEDLLDYVGK